LAAKRCTSGPDPVQTEQVTSGARARALQPLGVALTVQQLLPPCSPQDAFEIPVQVTVPGQPLPIPVKIKLQATTSDLILSPKTLDFGRVPLSEAAGVYITIRNPSALPQGFSFGSKLPLGLKLSPNSGMLRPMDLQESCWTTGGHWGRGDNAMR
jgi:hypothetical protein